MTLKTLTLTNFEGMKNFELNTDGKSVSVYGDNGTGKTTLADAQSWLLFDKDSAFTAGFMPKPRDGKGEELHDLSTEVEGTYILDDGSEVTLKKVFSENWKKKRGSAEAVFSGHTVSYFVDGVPKKEKEYMDFLDSLGGVQRLMLLTMPQYFPEVLDIKKRRELLMSLEKDIHEFAVISANEELEPLRHLMLKPGATANWYDMDQFIQVSKAAAKAANDELKAIPERIDEQSRNLTEITEEKAAKLRAEAGRLNAKKIALQLEQTGSESEMTKSLKADIAEIRAKLEERRAEHIRKFAEDSADITAKLAELRAMQQEQADKAAEIAAEYRESMRRLGRLRNDREELRQRWQEVSTEQWQGDTICPTCGQAIPEDRIAEAKAEFNLCKSKRLAEINEKGRSECSKEMILGLEKEAEALNSKVVSAEATVKKTAAEIESLSGQLNSPPPFESTHTYAELSQDMADKQAQIDAIAQCRYTKAAEKQAEISATEAQIADINRQVAEYEAGCRSRERIAELEKQQKLAAEAFARAQQGLDLAELFGRRKAEMLTEKINSHFENVRFRLFRVQINGGIQADCEVLAKTANGYIPYSTANNAARITAGLEIVRGFAKHYGMTAPVFVDNAESITHLDSSGLQVIRLVVSEEDKTLKIETEE